MSASDAFDWLNPLRKAELPNHIASHSKIKAIKMRDVYKKLLRLAKSLPKEKQAETLENIRKEFRNNMKKTDPSEFVFI